MAGGGRVMAGDGRRYERESHIREQEREWEMAANFPKYWGKSRTILNPTYFMKRNKIKKVQGAQFLSFLINKKKNE